MKGNFWIFIISAQLDDTAALQQLREYVEDIIFFCRNMFRCFAIHVTVH